MDCVFFDQDHPYFLVQEVFSLKEQEAHKEDQFFRGRQTVCTIYDYFQKIGAHDVVFDHADLFTTNNIRNDDVQEFDSNVPT